MSLGKQLVERLRLLGRAERIPPSPGPIVRYRNIQVTANVAHARVEFFDADRYSVALANLDVGIKREQPADLSTLAGAAMQQLAYLEEPLAIWELDRSENLVQLRSNPPQRDENEVSYWELVVRGGLQPAATLTRYRWAADLVEREVLPYPATFALLGRITDTLATVLLVDES